MCQILREGMHPFRLDRAGRRKNQTADAAHVNTPPSDGL
jgi:hypothetical protein